MKKVGSVLELQRGYDLPTRSRVAGEIPIISSSGYSGYHDEFKCDGENVITGRYGTIGNVYYYNGKCWPLNTSLYVKDFKGNIPKYIYYFLKNTLKLYQVNGNDKSAVPGIDRKIIHEMCVPFHEDTDYQKDICSVLNCLDHKITTNSNICSEMEAMAKTIYDYWFVQFDFPDENGKPYRTSGGEMVWNEQLKREIPKGWEIKKISNICEIISGYPFQSSTYSKTGKYRLITIKNVQDSGIDLNVDNYVEALPENLPDYCILSPGDILMSLTGNVGRVGLMYADDCLLNQRVALIKPKHSYLNVFLYFLFKSNRIKILMENISTGTSQKNLSPVDTGNLTIPFNSEIVKMFCDKLESVITKIVIAEKEKIELTKLRDWLLPMLMNGQARVE